MDKTTKSNTEFFSQIERSIQFEYLDGAKTSCILSDQISHHQFMVIGQVRNNGFSIQYKNGEKYSIEQGQGYCTPSETPYTSVSHNQSIGTFIWSHIHYTVFGGIPLSKIIHFTLSYTAEVGDEIARINLALHKISKKELNLQSIAQKQTLGFELLQILIENNPNTHLLNTQQLNHLHRIQNAILYIKENPVENVQVNQLAKLCHFSVSRFHEIFLETTGFTPHQYQTSLRIKKAQQLLKQNFTIAKIAGECGYDDPHYFSRLFKQQTGITASQYKSHYLNQEIVV